MKIRIFLAGLSVCVYLTFSGLLSFYRPVVAGYANAQQMKDSIEGYNWSNVVSSGLLDSGLFIIFLLLMFAIVFFPFNKTKKQNEN